MFDPVAIPIMAMMIPLGSVVLGMTIAIVAVVTIHRRKLRELEYRHRERMSAIEKGIDLPAEPEPSTVATPRTGLLRGLIWLGVGIALILGRLTGGASDLATLGWIPAAVGCAYLVYYFVEGRKRRDGPNGRPVEPEPRRGDSP